MTIAHRGDKSKYPSALMMEYGPCEQKVLLSSATKMQNPGRKTRAKVMMDARTCPSKKNKKAANTSVA
jgi:hypothetical protein